MSNLRGDRLREWLRPRLREVDLLMIASADTGGEPTYSCVLKAVQAAMDHGGTVALDYGVATALSMATVDRRTPIEAGHPTGDVILESLLDNDFAEQLPRRLCAAYALLENLARTADVTLREDRWELGLLVMVEASRSGDLKLSIACSLYLIELCEEISVLDESRHALTRAVYLCVVGQWTSARVALHRAGAIPLCAAGAPEIAQQLWPRVKMSGVERLWEKQRAIAVADILEIVHCLEARYNNGQDSTSQ